jgi:ABC-type antimicrobial peptide transport system permease subunit
VNFYLAARPQQGSPLALINPLKTALRAVTPDLNLTFRPLQEQVDASLAQERVVAAIAGFFAVLALSLAGIGLYGVISYGVAQRKTEIGIRMAIGAAPSDVRALVLSQAVIILMLGVGIGGAISIWAARLVAALLFNVPSRDPILFGEAAAMVFAVGIAASIVPAWRASRLDPSRILRQG